MVRYNTDGTLTRFRADGGGHPVGTIDGGYGVALQPDGKIVVSGYAYNLRPATSPWRYNTDGTLTRP